LVLDYEHHLVFRTDHKVSENECVSVLRWRGGKAAGYLVSPYRIATVKILNRRNRLGTYPHFHWREETDSVSETLFFLEKQDMYRDKKPGNPLCIFT
jgi:hypothetical protein